MRGVLTYHDNLLKGKVSKKLTAEQKDNIIQARQLVKKMLAQNKTIYGINTGFGKLSQVKITEDKLEALQCNLLRSHACGVGAPVKKEIIKIMMSLKIDSLAKGNSGCSLAVVEKLIELLDKNIIPYIPARGSVGASGDLAPLAHMSLPLIGEGEVYYNDDRVASENLVSQGVYEAISLGPKDGLSLINGTQYSTALLIHCLLRIEKIMTMAKLAAAMSIEADMATDVPFYDKIHKARNQKGEQAVACHIRNLLQGSEIIASHKDCEKVQDPYSYRCIPQVYGMVQDTIDFVTEIVEREAGSVTDNPLVFPEIKQIYSGGNFHAEPLAMGADYLAIAITEVGNMIERRIANLMDSNMSHLPPFLTNSSGVNSGFMIAHVTTAALTAENRTLANPASVETITTSANQEDHVSMAPNAGLKLINIIDNLEDIIVIELLVSAQGIDLRDDLEQGRGTALGYKKVRKLVPTLEKDRIMYKEFNKIKQIFSDDKFINHINKIIDKKME
ncbi:MAG: histidine ammonia-lyase [Candidatus Marinimicrobia bacterium]|nr:histidine ammonia-lyase [Candidatus Neomarinimicrobiota bacterium]